MMVRIIRTEGGTSTQIAAKLGMSRRSFYRSLSLAKRVFPHLDIEFCRGMHSYIIAKRPIIEPDPLEDF